MVSNGKNFNSVWELDQWLTARYEVHIDYNEDGEITPTLGHWGYASEEFSDELITLLGVGTFTEMGGSDSPGGFWFSDLILSSWCFLDCGSVDLQVCVDALGGAGDMEGIDAFGCGGRAENGWRGNWGRMKKALFFKRNKQASNKPPTVLLKNIPKEFREIDPKFRKRLDKKNK